MYLFSPGTLEFDPTANSKKGFKYNEEEGGIFAKDAGERGAAIWPNLGGVEKNKTIALLVRHTQSSAKTEEVFQKDSLVISRFGGCLKLRLTLLAYVPGNNKMLRQAK